MADAPTAPTDHAPPRSPWITFTICALALYLTTLDLSIVNVAFPDILTEFDISRADASWIVTIYNIFYGSLLVVTGKTADQLGRKRMFLMGLSIFAIGSAAAAVAPSLLILVVARAVQGIGGAMLTPASLGLLLAAFPLERR
ncbi:MAG: MFS transporter, partial [Actinomycetota bacterium]